MPWVTEGHHPARTKRRRTDPLLSGLLQRPWDKGRQTACVEQNSQALCITVTTTFAMIRFAFKIHGGTLYGDLQEKAHMESLESCTLAVWLRFRGSEKPWVKTLKPRPCIIPTTATRTEREPMPRWMPAQTTTGPARLAPPGPGYLGQPSMTARPTAEDHPEGAFL